MSKILGAVAHRAATNQTKYKLSTMTDVIFAIRKEAADREVGFEEVEDERNERKEKFTKICHKYGFMIDDKFWEAKKVELIMNPLKMKEYLVKKLYIDRLFKLLVVKLYNRTPPKKIEDNLYNNIISIYLKGDV